MAKLAALMDAFTAPAIDLSVWAWTSGTVSLDDVNGVVALDMPTTSGGVNSFSSVSLWDATDSGLYAQIGAPANGNGGAVLGLRLAMDANNAVLMRVEAGGAFAVLLDDAGTTSLATLPTYDPHQHRWWRITETDGAFVCSAGPDGLTWTVLATVAHAWPATSVQMTLLTAAASTEAAGNAATISHVNTRDGGTANPNWPDVRDEWAPFWHANGGDSPLDRYVDVSKRTMGSLSTSRGRQYELDQVQAGTYTATLADTDAALDPTNSASPWAGRIAPWQPYRKRAQWPATRNMLTQVQATGGDLGGQPLGPLNAGNSGPSIFTATDSSAGSIVSSTTAWQGACVLQFAVPASEASAKEICYTPQPGVAPGRTYTTQMRVRNVTAGTSIQVAAYMTFADVSNSGTPVAGTTVTLTGAANAPWTTVSVTGTAPVSTALVYSGVLTAAVPAAACSVQVDGWQMEEASAPSAWTCPGIWYPIFGGFVEDWASQWTMGGTYGTVLPTITDAMALLSQRTLDDPLSREVSVHSPRFQYKLDDPSEATQFTDSTGNRPAAQLGASKYGTGSFAAGAQITATDAAGMYTGGADSVAVVANPSPGKDGSFAATFLDLTSAGIRGPAAPLSWTRMIAFRWTGGAITNTAGLWSSTDRNHNSGFPTGSRLYLYINASGHLNVDMFGPTTGFTFPFSTANVADGNWHLAIFGYDGPTQEMNTWIDNAPLFYAPIPTANAPTGLVSDAVGAYVDSVVRFCADNWAGNVSYVTEFPALLGIADATGLYSAWRSSCAGESTDARYARILRYAGYIGPSSVQTGLTRSMGPADVGGQDALTALQAVVDTEGGAHYVDSAGTVTFQARSARYDTTAPVHTFGEDTAAGEWPYEDCQLDYDSTHLGNVVTVTQESSGQVFTAQDATSITNYFPRTLSRTVNATDPLECQDAASYLLSRYKDPATRVSTLQLHPSANPAMWPVCLSLELGMRIRVMRRPPGVPPIVVDCFVENIAWTMDDTGEAVVVLQCSPADLTPYGVISAWHTTLAVDAPAGSTTITITPGETCIGPLPLDYTLWIAPELGGGTPGREAVEVTKRVGDVITLLSPLVGSYLAGEVVTESLPDEGDTPDEWDGSSAFDSMAFTY